MARIRFMFGQERKSMECSGVYNPNRYLLTKHEVNVIFVP